MTLDDVMALEGRELNEAVAERVRWKRADYDGGWFMPDGSKTNKFHIPEFSDDWNAAMQVREWARGTSAGLVQYAYRLREVLDARLGFETDVFLYAEPIDYARAALLVSP